jgi:hypothetical protein
MRVWLKWCDGRHLREGGREGLRREGMFGGLNRSLLDARLAYCTLPRPFCDTLPSTCSSWLQSTVVLSLQSRSASMHALDAKVPKQQLA